MDNLKYSFFWVSNLGAYNSGRVNGDWIYLKDIVNHHHLRARINKIISKYPSYGDEWAIHDYNDFPDMGENPDLKQVMEIAYKIEEEGFDKINAFLDVYSIEDLDHFEDSYSGEWRDFKEYAEDFFDACYSVPDNLANYIDYEKFANDLSYDYSEVDNPNGGVFVFRSF
tara:strand:- start:88 stop:594 length:507 start_codon:yes stop_codon:yes gene_type:complete